MSVQLIIYPQSYEGSNNGISGTPSEFIVDGINFNTINTSTQYVASAPFPQNAINFYAPTLPLNNWDRYNSLGGGIVSATSGDLLFSGGSSGTEDCGIIQKLSNLTIGIDYTVSLDIASVSATADLFVNTYNGTILNSTATLTQSVGVVSTTFTANATDQTILIGTSGIGAIIVSSISTQQVSGSTVASISDGQVICDLYEDEDIPLSLSVDDFKNVAEKVQSYSKAFNLPATKRNNRIFDQIFEITRSDDGIIFNPYKKTQCVLKQDGFILFEGYLRLLDVTDKEGEISYNVNLYSEVVALADVLKDRAFRDLDFTELEHEYNRTQIEVSWNDAPSSGITYTNPSTSGFRDANSTVKYPFVDWNHQFIVGGSSNSGNSATDGNPELTSLEQAFRPFINIKYLIDRIFESTPFTYGSSLFDTTEFKKLYMDFNWGSAQAPNNNLGEGFGENDDNTGVTAGLTATKIPFDVETFSNASDLGFDSSTSRFTASFDNQVYFIQGVFKFSYSGWTSGLLGYLGWEKYDNTGTATGFFPILNQLQSNGTSSGNISSSFNQTVVLNTGESLRPSFWKLDAGVTLTQLTTQQLSAFSSNGATVITGTTTTTSETLLQTLRGETGQWDFLKGILTMFNLVTLPDENNPNNILIEPYADVFLNNTATPLDWTDKIDVSEMKLEPLADLNKKTIFKFVEDEDDYAFTNYKNQVGGHLYGSKMYDAGNEFNILVGEDEIVAEPFAATVVKPLMSQFPSFITPALYSYNADDGTSEGFDNSPRIMYNNGVKSTGASYYIPEQNGVTSDNETYYLQFSHLTDVPTVVGSKDFHFGECQLLTGVGSPVPDNLFNLYWLPYYSELYNPNTRIMTIKVNLTPADINTFKFNDTVFLKNRTFRVNKIDYKPNDLATVEFILIP